jgi:RNA polymerase sigma factor (sigma-70 family)
MTASVNVEQLLRQCQQGNEEALARIMQHFEQPLYRLALRVCGNSALAEEATVQTFYKVWCKAGQWQGQSPAEAWIYRIAVRTVLDLQRAQRRWQKRLHQAGSVRARASDPGPVETLAARELHDKVTFELEQAIKTLSEEDRLLHR